MEFAIGQKWKTRAGEVAEVVEIENEAANPVRVRIGKRKFMNVLTASGNADTEHGTDSPEEMDDDLMEQIPS